MKDRQQKRRQKVQEKRKQAQNALQIARWLDQAYDCLESEEYAGALRLCRQVLDRLDVQDKRRIDALTYLSHAHAMRKEFDNAYAALCEAVGLAPDDAYLWYNKGMSALFTGRAGQSVLDMERAVALEGGGQMAAKFAEQLAFVREVAQSECALRGPDFGLPQLIAQQELYRMALAHFEAREWEKSETLFRMVIQLGDCLPQPWGNLGICLVMQRRFDEAERAYQRALEVDPGYELARRHWDELPVVRASGLLPEVVITDPYQQANVTSHWVKEQE